MRVQAAELDVIAENLANVSTPGFRARQASLSFGDELQVTVRSGAAQGSLRNTGVRTDFALSGPGYFSVATPSGVEYTRDGRMLVDAHGYLTDTQGNRVLGRLGPVQFPQGARVDEAGRVIISGKVTDRLRIVAFNDTGEQNFANRFAASPGWVPTRSSAHVQAGYLEDSGVDPIAQMSALISAQRAYEANQKSAQRTDESLRRVVTDLPVLRG
jgi:flagellar basal body rod protein FlgG